MEKRKKPKTRLHVWQQHECAQKIFGSWWKSSTCTSIMLILLSLLFSFHCICQSDEIFNFWHQLKNIFNSTFIWMFANIFNKVVWKNNARYISQKLESLFVLCTWGILCLGLWLTHSPVYAGWGTCGVQCEGGKIQCIQVQHLNKHSVKLAWILTTLWNSWNIWNVVNAGL